MTTTGADKQSSGQYQTENQEHTEWEHVIDQGPNPSLVREPDLQPHDDQKSAGDQGMPPGALLEARGD